MIWLIKRTENGAMAISGVTLKKWKSTRLLVMALAFLLTSSCRTPETGKSSENQQNKMKSKNMKSVLIIGMDPHAIDFSNPEIPQGLTAEKIEAGIGATVEKLNSMGFAAEVFLIETKTADLGGLADQLREKNYDGIVIGNGIRSLASHFLLFERIVNVVHTNAPHSKMIFNSLPTDTDEAVKRWL